MRLHFVATSRHGHTTVHFGEVRRTYEIDRWNEFDLNAAYYRPGHGPRRQLAIGTRRECLAAIEENALLFA